METKSMEVSLIIENGLIIEVETIKWCTEIYTTCGWPFVAISALLWTQSLWKRASHTNGVLETGRKITSQNRP